ncbi:MAG: RHS repeat-associated core domain-containing protein, partial [Kurthia sp.]|nr:RHS repeat-associated core domain-containing protein [Candidatus Kurthia equi]
MTGPHKENSDDIDQLKYGLDGTNAHTYTVDTDIANSQTTLTLNADLLVQVAKTNDSNLINSLVYTTKQQTPFEIAYEYTKNGNISKETVNDTSSLFEYDKNDQLIKETLSDGTINSYEYDAVGNRTQSDVNGIVSTFTYNDANQIKTKNDTAFEYDKDGNLLQDENYKYTYNQQQRLTQVDTLEGKLIASYTYDENGLRLTKTVGDTTHEYFYNDEVLDMEVVKVNDAVTEYRSYEWNGYTPLGMIVKTKNDANNFETKAYQFITNHRGDVLSIRDSEDNEVGSYTYDAYGNILAAEGALAKANPIRYAGYYYDDETKNYYLQARYYNPANGSFLALDPHPGDDNEPLSQNGYIYTSGNPVMKVDPNGLLDLRTRDIANSINAAISLIPYLGPLQKAMKSGLKSQVKKLMDKNKTVEKLTKAVYKGLVNLNVKTKKARTISKAVAGFINAFVGYSIGQAVVFVLKKNFKTITKNK